MSCKLWKERAFAYTEGLLSASEARTYREHMAECAICSAEVTASLGLSRSLRDLPDPVLGRDAAQAFDTAVLARLRTSESEAPVAAAISPESRVARALALAAARRAGQPLPAEPDHRSLAARTIAARSRQAVRPASPPAPSFMLASLALAALSIAVTIFFGEWMVSTIGTSLTLALGALGEGGGWLAEAVGARFIELVAVFRVVRVLADDVGPVFDGMRQLASVRGSELMVVSVLAALMLGLAGFIVRRDRSIVRERGHGNSS